MVVFLTTLPELLPSAGCSGSSDRAGTATRPLLNITQFHVDSVVVGCSLYSRKPYLSVNQTTDIAIRLPQKKRLSPFSCIDSRCRSGIRRRSKLILALEANCTDGTMLNDNHSHKSSRAMLDDDAGVVSDTPLLQHQSMSSSKLLTLPTILTLARVAAIPVLLCVFYSTEWWATTAVAWIFVLAAITDWLDGFLARKMGTNSTFGAFLDPVADKLMVATTLVLLCTKPLSVSWAMSLPWLIPLPSAAIIGREITMSAVREWAASQGGDVKDAVAVNNLGKWKTACQLVALTALLATRNASETGMAGILVGLGVGLLYISAGLAVWSLAVYMKGIWGALIK